MDSLINNYKLFLISTKVKDSSIKNYLVDARNFINWYILYLETNKRYRNLSNELLFHNLTVEAISSYKQFLIENNTPEKTINRRLSGVRKLASYAISQSWISNNPAKEVGNIGSEIKEPIVNNWISETVKQFKEEIAKDDISKLSVKNYVSDVNGFLRFVDQVI